MSGHLAVGPKAISEASLRVNQASTTASVTVSSKGCAFLQGQKCSWAPVSSSRRHHASSRLVVEAKGKKSAIPGQFNGRNQQQPSMPKIDPNDDTPKFVLFIKTKNVNRWYPLSIVSGGTTAKLMVNIMKNEWGKKLYGGTLTRNIAAVVYKDERAMSVAALKQYPMLKGASGFEFGYKIMDPQNPNAAMFGSNVEKIPPQEELKTAVDKAVDFFKGSVDSIKESFGTITPLGGSESDSSDSSKKTDSK